MAGNKFATMLHRNAHKITVLLVYAVLEWILIILLLLNSFFTYLITKFASYFGLKPPCPWCSRVDHILEPANNRNSYRDLVCDKHATEISTLTYCSSHKKLAETQHLCMECLASRPQHNDESTGMTQRIAFISWLTTHKLENKDEVLLCSCCNESLRSKLCPSYLLFKSSWDSLDYTHTGGLISEAMDDDSKGSHCKEQRKAKSGASLDENDNEIEINSGEECHNDKNSADEFHVISDVDSFGLTEVAEENCSRSESNMQYEEKEAYEGEEAGKDSVHSSCGDMIIHQCCYEEDELLEVINLGYERNFHCDFNRVIPIQLIDSSTTINQVSCNLEDDESETYDPMLQCEIQASALGETQLIRMDESEEMTRYKELERLETAVDEVKDSSVLNVQEDSQDLVGEACEQVISNLIDQTLCTNSNEVGADTRNQLDNLTAQIEDKNETKSKNLNCTEADDQIVNQPQDQESVPPLPCLKEDQSPMINASEACISQNDLDEKHIETDTTKEKMSLVCKNQEGTNHNLSMRPEASEADEEKFPETPTSTESFHYLHKKLLLFEKRESGTEESLDGSVVSEMESSDPVLTIERLKSALKVERKALSALYTELEEERSASAIAANQTMAMITRLQEEKAAMQMEALQYQRMMEEQSEYDQEALQLLNELMVKREKEKQELEKELEIYRKKVLDYEAKEKMRMRRSVDGSVKSRNSSASCSNSEDTDELSIDLNREARDEDNSFYGHQESSSDNAPADEVINLEEMALDCVKHMTALDESLTEFEEERLSILDQLKVLEEKLLSVGDDEFIEDLKSINQSSKYGVNEFDESPDLSNPKENEVSNGFSKDRLYPERKSMASMARSLLPLLDATDNDTEGLIYDEQVEFGSSEMQNSSVSTFDVDSKKIALVEEVDHVYERLQALEADREFLKHCVSSVNKGDKGMDLLQEILQHLRDLRAVELHVRNMDDDTQILLE